MLLQQFTDTGALKWKGKTTFKLNWEPWCSEDVKHRFGGFEIWGSQITYIHDFRKVGLRVLCSVMRFYLKIMKLPFMINDKTIFKYHIFSKLHSCVVRPCCTRFLSYCIAEKLLNEILVARHRAGHGRVSPGPMTMPVFWDLTPCTLVCMYQRIEVAYCLYLRGSRAVSVGTSYISFPRPF